MYFSTGNKLLEIIFLKDFLSDNGSRRSRTSTSDGSVFVARGHCSSSLKISVSEFINQNDHPGHATRAERTNRITTSVEPQQQQSYERRDKRRLEKQKYDSYSLGKIQQGTLVSEFSRRVQCLY